MLRRPLVLSLLTVFALIGVSAAVYAQLETGDRGILPIESTGTLEVTGIHVDVGGTDAQTARYAAWRLAEREGFRKLYAQTHSVPESQAPNLPDSSLDDIVTSINVEHEQIGPNRYIADLGLLFDRARAAPFLGVQDGQVQRSNPMLLIPIMVTGGTETSVEVKNAWQRAWALFRTSDSPIDYVRVSGLGVDPLLVNAAQTTRPGRSSWRNLLDLYGTSDILVAEVQVQRLYPGGPLNARFIGRHGPDGAIVGGFSLTQMNGDMNALMTAGVQRMDHVFADALAAGQLTRDESLNQPPPPPMPEQPAPEVKTPPKAAVTVNSYQVQVSGGDVRIYNFAMAHLRTLPGVDSATPQLINPNGTSYILVTYHGDIQQLAAALAGRGWMVESVGTVIKLKSASNAPPPIPPPPAPAPAAPPPAQPVPQPAIQPPPHPPGRAE
jgi:hypothetical protein